MVSSIMDYVLCTIYSILVLRIHRYDEKNPKGLASGPSNACFILQTCIAKPFLKIENKQNSIMKDLSPFSSKRNLKDLTSRTLNSFNL